MNSPDRRLPMPASRRWPRYLHPDATHCDCGACRDLAAALAANTEAIARREQTRLAVARCAARVDAYHNLSSREAERAAFVGVRGPSAGSKDAGRFPSEHRPPGSLP